MDVYDPESYWSRVAEEIRKRPATSFVAGDDTPYYRYKRNKFLRRFLGTLEFRSRVVLEVGCGPGGNLLHILPRCPRRLIGVDISASMIDLAAMNLGPLRDRVELHKIDGARLPFADREIDLCLTVTVLQHNLDSGIFEALLREICRVSRESFVLVEDTDRRVVAGGSAVRRPVADYQAVCAAAGFRLAATDYLNTRVSFFSHRAIARLWRSLFGYEFREGEQVPAVLQALLGVGVGFGRPFDELLPERVGLTRMTFVPAGEYGTARGGGTAGDAGDDRTCEIRPAPGNRREL